MSVGLNNAKCSEAGKIEALGNHLCPHDDVVIALVDFGINFIEFEVAIGIHIETSDFCFWKEATQFILDEFSAEALMVDAGIFTLGAGSWNRKVARTGMATHLKGVGVEYEGEEAVWAKCLPATTVANRHRCGATAIMKEHGLSMGL